MANTGDMLGTAVSGLLAFQRNLSTIGHNISNVNTEGYSRQSVEMGARTPIQSANGFIGTGVDVNSVRRVYDQFLNEQVTSRTSSYNQLDTLQTMASSIDDLLANEDAGLSPVLQNFFNALQDVSNDPTSIPARQVLLSEGETLSNRFQSLDQRLTDMRDLVNDQVGSMTNEINGLASSIAELNATIVLETGAASGQPPNDLLDKRDLLLNKLSELVSVSTVDNTDGSINVFVGNGQTLVLGTDANSLTTTRSEYDQSQLEISIAGVGSNIAISDQLSGGKLGGLLDFRQQILDPAQNSLGRIAIALADTFNTQHQLGDDINGNPGGLFFNSIVTSSPTVFASSNNNPASGTVSVSISDSNFIQASDYRLDYDGANFSLTRISDNTVVDSGFTIADLPRTVASDGITLNLAGSVAAGDSFLIRPVRNGASDINMALTDPAQFAAAASGSALGDNSNALALVGLQSQKVMGGGSESFHSAYAKLVSTIGAKTSETKVNARAQDALLNRAIESQQAVSGVNLDEEAANLLKFQQAYQAAAQVISASNSIFQTLLSATSR